MVIQHNIPAINSHRNLLINNNATSKNLEKLSSGYRINRAGDDAAGLAISEKMRGQIRGLAKAEDNASHAINLIQTAEGGLQETHAILQRMRELAVQASNGTYQDDDRANIALEVDALKNEIDRIASATEYNGMKLLDGSLGGTTKASTLAISVSAGGTLGADGTYTSTIEVIHDGTNMYANVNGRGYEKVGISNTVEDENGAEFDLSGVTSETYVTGLAFSYTISGVGTVLTAGSNNAASRYIGDGSNQVTFQIGANGTADQQVSMGVGNMSTVSLGDGNDFLLNIDISTRAKANLAIDVIDGAINQVSAQRAELGALQNRLEHTLNNLGVTKENLTAAESTIRDVDMAKEMMEFTKNSILVQASQAMLAQANALPQGVLSLLR